jgi:hypothetical protein
MKIRKRQDGARQRVDLSDGWGVAQVIMDTYGFDLVPTEKFPYGVTRTYGASPGTPQLWLNRDKPHTVCMAVYAADRVKYPQLKIGAPLNTKLPWVKALFTLPWKERTWSAEAPIHLLHEAAHLILMVEEDAEKAFSKRAKYRGLRTGRAGEYHGLEEHLIVLEYYLVQTFASGFLGNYTRAGYTAQTTNRQEQEVGRRFWAKPWFQSCRDNLIAHQILSPDFVPTGRLLSETFTFSSASSASFGVCL